MADFGATIMLLANDAWRDYQMARDEAERQQAIDQAAGIERLAAKELGIAFADGLPWNVPRQANQ